MNTNELIKNWKAEEEIAHIHGWDFSHIDGRYTEQDDLPWDYRAVIEDYLTPDTELLSFLKEINGKLKNQPNTLTRYLNAQSGPLRERYGVEYTPSRENNVKYICLEPVCDNSDTSDVSEGASDTENTELIGQSA